MHLEKNRIEMSFDSKKGKCLQQGISGDVFMILDDWSKVLWHWTLLNIYICTGKCKAVIFLDRKGMNMFTRVHYKDK